MRRTVIIAFIPLMAYLHSSEPVSAGKGSYAGAPPDEKEVKELFSFLPSIEPEMSGRALPSNSWWTSQLSNPWPGKMWATPATVSANPAGVQIWYPKGWLDNGCEMEQGEPLQILGDDRSPPGPDSDIVVCDFEFDAWPGTWKVTGTGWGKGPTDNLAAPQKAAGIVGRRYANGFLHEGDSGQGEAISAPFSIQRDYISLLVGGGSDGGKARVGLEIDGKEIFSASGKNSWQHHPVLWDVRPHKGKKARLHLIDRTGGGWGWVSVDHVIQTNNPEPSSGIFKVCSTKHWSDWMQVMRLRNSQDRFIDVTYGHGLPFVWIECKEMDLKVPLEPADSLADTSGKPLRLPFAGDALVLLRGSRAFALFAPENTEFRRSADGVKIHFSSDNRYLVAALLPDAKFAKEFQKYAYAVPRETKMTYNYDRAAGEVATTWNVKAQALRGSSTQVLQGWLPHHYRMTRHKLPFIDAVFDTLRGRLRLAPGNSFEISWPFKGILPVLPSPEAIAGAPNPYKPERMADLIRKWTAERASKPYGGHDTYWGAKEFLRMAQTMAMARQLGMPEADKLRDLTRDVLSDWLTYTPGETSRYFAKYPHPWSGIVGFKTSYGSGKFTDNHFHYGYFTLAGALLGMEDPQWVADFAPMLRLIAKQYANWERDDKDFPFLRCFDPWNGHCYAGGTSNTNDGNNQESSSESMGAWTGLFLLGNILGDDEMTAAGAMGWAIESEAVAEYWNDYYAWKTGPEASNYSPKYKNKHSIVSVLRDRDIGFWTWFSGEPIHIYGIQWLPLWTSLQYMARDPEFSAWQLDNMLKAQGKGEPVPLTKLGDDWGNIALTPLIFGDPARSAKILDEAYETNDKLGQFHHATPTYYFTHSMRSLGNIAWECHASVPTSTVFHNQDGGLAAVIYNPAKNEIKADIYRGTTKIATVTAPPGIISKHEIIAK